MQKALIENYEYETDKHNVLSYGLDNYTVGSSYSEVELTDWPMLEGTKLSKKDVYYSYALVDGKHFISKWNTLLEISERKKRKAIYDIATHKYIEDIMYAIKARHDLELLAAIPTTLTALQYTDFMNWTATLAVLHNSFDVSTITMEDIYFGNYSVFPAIPHDPKLNGFV